ncbi:MAG: hypothetical protein GY938_11405, partial [Ketobacter sp.]|nr:hypothetical protein [Ketobacter sp.]
QPQTIIATAVPQTNVQPTAQTVIEVGAPTVTINDPEIQIELPHTPFAPTEPLQDSGAASGAVAEEAIQEPLAIIPAEDVLGAPERPTAVRTYSLEFLQACLAASEAGRRSSPQCAAAKDQWTVLAGR